VCVGSVTPAFTDATAGGTWSITNGTGAATITSGGVVTGTAAGTVTVVYSFNNGTCTNTATTPLTVNALPVVSAIGGGATAVCVGSATPAFTDATAGGVWSITPGTGAASITSSGVVTGTTAGTVTVNYAVTTNGCTTTQTKGLTVNDIPAAPAAIGGGATGVCVGSATPAFTDATTGGVWSITPGTGAATITSGGVVTGTTAGTVTVVYTVTNGSGCTNTATVSLTVNALPVVSAIGGGATTVCQNSSTPAFTDATTGGTWSITAGTGTASITAGGVVTGLTAGSVTVNYTVTNASNCTTTQTKALTVNVQPAAPAAIGGGAAAVCVGSSTVPFTDATAGGAWSIIGGSPGAATITTGGVVTGTTAGTVTVVYTVTSGTCTNTATTSLTVNALPAVSAIGGGASAVCVGSVTPAFTDATAGGTWSITNGTGAATITSGGVVTGTAAGTVTVVYSFNNGTCTNTATTPLTVNALPVVSAIGGGATAVCVGSATPAFTDATAGGVWSITPGTGAASITSSGVVTGTTAGTVTVNYAVTTNGCTTTQTKGLTVNDIPAAPAAIGGGATGVCVGSATPAFTDATTGGVWSITPGTGAATITSGGVVTGTTAGTVTVVYTVTNGSGCTNTATVSLTVNALPAAVTITPSSASICSNATTATLLTASGGGSASPTILSQNFSSIAPWTTTNTSTGGTPAFAAWTLRTSPYVYTQSGGGNVTFNSTSTGSSQFILSNSDAQGNGGTTNTIIESPAFSTVGYTSVTLSFYQYLRYTSGDVASVQISNNNTTWVNLGTFTSTQGALTAFANQTYSLPAANLGQATVYIRFTYQATFDWYWALANINITGVASSTNPITWTPVTGLYTNASATTAYVAGTNSSTVYALPTSTTTYTATATNAGGCISSGNTTITVNALPTVAAIGGGASSVCSGSTTPAFTDATPGGVWSIANGTGTATITAGGIVTGGTAGSVTVVYTFTNSNGCSSTATTPLTINALPTVAAIGGGSAAVCTGSPSAPFTDATTGGTWSITNGTGTATITAGGVVTGGTAGSVTVVYTYTNANGCTSSTSTSITVNQSPSAIVISPASATICTGASQQLIATGGGGVTQSILDSSVFEGDGSANRLLSNGSAVDRWLTNTSGSQVNNQNYWTISFNTGCEIDGKHSLEIFRGTGTYCSYYNGVATNTYVYRQFSSVGYSNVQLTFSYKAGGDGTTSGTGNDYGTVTYSTDGINWTDLPTHYSMQTTATTVTVQMPAALNNATGVYYGFRWTTNASGGSGNGFIVDDVYMKGTNITSSSITWAPATNLVLSSTGDTVIASPTTTTTYTATSTVNGCSSSTDVLISVNPTPVASISEANASICSGSTDDMTITGTVGASVIYSINGANQNAVAIGSDGTYHFTTINLSANTTFAIVSVSNNGCTSTTGNSVTVTILPTPAPFSMGGGGAYCDGGSGSDVYLTGSETGVNYQLLLNGNPVGSPLAGTTGVGVLDFGQQTSPGTYTVSATNVSSSCTKQMPGAVTVSITPLPNFYNVGGGGSYCAGGTGVSITLDGSDLGVNYQLKQGATTVQTLPGTGNPLSFNNVTGAGNYSIRTNGSCVALMSGSASVIINPLPAAPAETVTQPTCSVATGIITINSPTGSGLTYSIDGVNYQSGLVFNNVSSGSYTVYVMNSNGCVASSTTMVNPQPITPGSPSLDIVSPATCTIATATIAVHSPIAGYTYSLDGGAFGTATSFVVSAGVTHTVAASTGTCQSIPTSVSIDPQPVTPATPTVTLTQPTCAVPSGTVTVTNFVGGFTYSDDGTTYSNTTGVFSGLAGGTYQIYANNGSCPSAPAQAIINNATAAPNAPTALILSGSTSGTFTAPSPAAADYLVIRTTGSVPSAPATGTTYTAGTSALGGYIVAVTAATSFTDNTAVPGTSYTYYVYSYNTGSCVVYSATALSGTQVAICTTPSTLFWAGSGTTIPGGGNTNTSTNTQFNNATNWSTSGSSYTNASSLAPAACTDLMMNLSTTGNGTHTIAMSGNTTVASLTINANFTGGDIYTIDAGSFAFNAAGNVSLSAPAAGGNIKLTTEGGLIDIRGTATIGASADAGSSSIGNGDGTTVGGVVKFRGNVAFNANGSVSNPLNVSAVFDAAGAQTLTNNTTVSKAVTFVGVTIGDINTPALTLAGSAAAYNYVNGGNFAVSAGSSLILPRGYGFTQLSTSTGIFSAGAGATVSVQGDGIGAINAVAGSNFPGGFGTYAIDPSSTFNYYSADGVNQTVYAPVTYGNLALGNTTGSGNTTKLLTATVTGIAGNITTTPFTTFDIATFNANRTAAGGTFNLAANSTLRLSGTTNGASANNNFPSGFVSSLDPISTTEYYGATQGVNNTAAYGNLTITTAGTKTAVGSVTVAGNVLINPAATFDGGGSFTHNVAGNWTNNGNFASQTSTVNFNGSAVQTIGTTAGVTSSFNNLTVNQSTAAGITVSGPIQATGVLNLMSGVVTPTNAGKITVTETGSTTNASNASYVSGAVTKNGSTAFVFPVGKSNGYVPVGISATSDNSTKMFTAEYIRSSATALGPVAQPSPLNHVSNCDYWNVNYNPTPGTISHDNLPGGTTVKLTLYWNANNPCDNTAYVTNLPTLTIAHFDSTTNTWNQLPGAPVLADATNLTDNNISYEGLNSFSPFSLASTQSDNPLPVVLVNFEAVLNSNKTVGLTWTTQQEVNTDHFEVERSADGINWIKIGTVTAVGNSSVPSNYGFTDNSPLKANYYRIKMVNISGQYGYTIVKEINILQVKGIVVFPNPARNYVNISVSQAAVDLNVKLMDPLGRILQVSQVKAGTSSMITLDVHNYAQGTYLVQVAGSDGTQQTTKVVIMR